MARSFLDTVRGCIRRHGLVVAGDTVLAAVSGGADSIALLTGLVALRDALGVRVVAAHLDHGVRGAASASDRVFVEEVARRLDVPCLSEEARIPSGNFEAEARRVRYAFLERAADAVDATKIATGHTLEDQAETVFLRLVRGSGRRGLTGIRPRRGRIIRPLLDCDRMQVRAFLIERGEAWRRDYTNFDLDLERARVRHGFLPALTRELNPRLSRTLADLAELVREEDALLDRLAAAAARGRTLTTSVLAAIEPPLARRAIRIWWRRHGSGRRLGRAHIEAVRGLVARTSDDGAIAVPGGTVRREHGRLAFDAAANVAVTEDWEMELLPDRPVDTPGGWRLVLETMPPEAASEPSDSTCIVDADRVDGVFAVRNRRPGDRMRLHGLDGRTSLKRLLAARRVPRARRAHHPIVTSDGGVLWVPGCGRSDTALVTPATTRRWVVRVIQSPNESA